MSNMYSKYLLPILVALLSSTITIANVDVELSFEANRTQICDGDLVLLTNTTENFEQLLDEYQFYWEMPDGQGGYKDTVYGVKFYESSIGDGIITLKLERKGTKELIKSQSLDLGISFWGKPDISITSSLEERGRVSVCRGIDVDLSPNFPDPDREISTYTWFLGLSTAQYTENAEYETVDIGITSGSDVRLEIMDEYGCQFSYERENYVEVKDKEAPSFGVFASVNDRELSQGTIRLCEKDVTFTTETTGLDFSDLQSYTWNYLGEDVPSVKTVTGQFSGFDRYETVTLSILDNNGCIGKGSVAISTMEYKVEINVEDANGNDVTNLDEAQCEGEFKFDAPGSNDSLLWNKNGNDIYNETEDTVLYTFYSENAEISVVSIGRYPGCIDTATIELLIEPKPILTPIIDPPYACVPTDFTFDLTSNVTGLTGTVEFVADTSDTDSKPVSFPHVREFDHGIHELIISSVSPAGCQVDDTTISFEVAVPKIKANLFQPSSHCIPHTVAFTDSLTYKPETFEDAVVSFEWDIDGTVGVDHILTDTVDPKNKLKTVFEEVGDYDCSYKITTAEGCVVEDLFNILVGDNVSINYVLSDNKVCGFNGLLYTDLCTDPSLIDYVQLKVISEEGTHSSNNPRIEAPTWEAQAVIGAFDTIGPYNISVTASYNECQTTRSYMDSIEVMGPIARAKTFKDCDMEWNRFDFTLGKDIGVSDSCAWAFYKTGLDTVFVDSIVRHRDSIFPFFVSEPSDYFAVVYATSDQSDCKYRDTIRFSATRPSITYTPDIEGLCMRDTLFFFDTGVLQISDGYRNITGCKVVTTYPNDSVDTVSISTNPPMDERDTFKLKYAGVYNFEFIATDVHSCKAYDYGHVKKYNPIANAITADSVGCLPIDVAYTNLSQSDTTFANFYWSTNSDSIPDGETTSLDERFQTQYARKSEVELTLIAHTIPVNYTQSEGCIDTAIITGAVRPIIPPLGLLKDGYTEKMCLHTPMTIERTDEQLDVVEWKFGEQADWVKNADTKVEHTFDTAGTYVVGMRVMQSHTDYGDCYNDTIFNVDVKDYKINLVKEPDIPQCFTLGTWLVYDSATNWAEENIESFTYYTDTSSYEFSDFDDYPDYQNFQDKRMYIYRKSPGRHYAVLQVETGYEGCGDNGVISDTLVIDVYGGNVELEVSSDTVCVGDEFTVQFKKDENALLDNFSWALGDGSFNLTDTLIKHTYDTVPASGHYEIGFGQECYGQVQGGEPIVKDVILPVYLYEIESRFLVNDQMGKLESCPPLTVELTNESFGYDSLFWNFGNGTTSDVVNPDSLVYDQPGDYAISLRVKNPDCEHTIKRHITIHPVPEISIDSVADIKCEENPVQLIATSDGDYTYEWDDASYLDDGSLLTPTFTPADSTRLFKLLATNEFDCKATDSVLVRVQNRPYYNGNPESAIHFLRDGLFVPFRPTDTLVVLEHYLMNNDSIPGINYKWTPSTYLNCDTCANPQLQVLDEIPKIKYEVRMTDTIGCFDEQYEMDLTIIKNTMVDLPSAFSPNGDGENDMLYVRGWAIRELIEVRVYNRWGQLVFQTNDMNEGWDGTYNGEPQAADIYAYKMRIVNFEGEEEYLQGDVQLVR